MVNRVYHKSDEIHRMARAALDRGYTSGDTDIVKKIRELQPIVLPEDRQKKITGRGQIIGTEAKPNILDVMDTLAANGYKPRSVMIDEAIAAVDATHEAEIHQANGHSVEIATDEEYEAVSTESNLGATVDMFMKSCAKQLVEQFMSHLRVELAAAVQKEFMPAIMPALKAAKVVRQKILVMGLKPQQAAMIVNEFGNEYDLRFVDSGRSASAADGKLNVDHIIGMTNFMSHAAEDHIKKHPGYKRVSGGMDSLRDALRSIN
jgi:hypothetical protein